MSSGMEQTRGQLEAAISEAMIRFEKEFMGRGPLEAKTYIIDDIILVRLQGVLTPAEMRLAEGVEGDREGQSLIKQVRQALIERGRALLENSLQDIVGIPVQSLHTDISAQTGERVIVFTMQRIVPYRRASDRRAAD